MTGSKQVDHWTSGTVCEYSEIAGSPQNVTNTPDRKEAQSECIKENILRRCKQTWRLKSYICSYGFFIIKT
jgi:hypothetical protein